MKAKVKSAVELLQEGWRRGKLARHRGALLFPDELGYELRLDRFTVEYVLGREVKLLRYVPPSDNALKNGFQVRLNDTRMWLPPEIFVGITAPADKTKAIIFDRHLRFSEEFPSLDERIEFYGDRFVIGCRKIKSQEMTKMLRFVADALGYKVTKQ